MTSEIKKINAAWNGKNGQVKNSTGKSFGLGAFKRLRTKGPNYIMDFETGSVGVFTAVGILSIVKKETHKGWTAGDLLESLEIDGVELNQAIAAVL